MKFNWVQLLTVIPYVVMGIQQIHTDAKGATKKQLALESLGLATATASSVLPEEQAVEAQAVSGAVGNIIDEMVTTFHATNAPGFGVNSLPPASGSPT